MLIGTTDLNTTLNLTYVLTDVVETLLLDMRSEMKKQGYDLRLCKKEFGEVKGEQEALDVLSHYLRPFQDVLDCYTH